MRDVHITKTRLLAKLEANKADHDKAFHEASAAFYEKFNKELEAVTEHVAEKELNYQQAMGYLQKEQPPQGHCDEYEREIAMLQFDNRKEITLTQDEFTRFVLDEWYWKEEFATSYFSTTGKFLGT